MELEAALVGIEQDQHLFLDHFHIQLLWELVESVVQLPNLQAAEVDGHGLVLYTSVAAVAVTDTQMLEQFQ
jgi:hypothetical protein